MSLRSPSNARPPESFKPCKVAKLITLLAESDKVTEDGDEEEFLDWIEQKRSGNGLPFLDMSNLLSTELGIKCSSTTLRIHCSNRCSCYLGVN